VLETAGESIVDFQAVDRISTFLRYKQAQQALGFGMVRSVDCIIAFAPLRYSARDVTDESVFYTSFPP
jgi:hypothetical protein